MQQILYLNKNIIKKLKRTPSNNLLFEQFLKQELKVLETSILITNGTYEGKLCSQDGIVFDYSDEHSVIFWDFLRRDEVQQLLSTRSVEIIEENQILSRIEGNQFVKVVTSGETVLEDIKPILNSPHLERLYELDSIQTSVLNELYLQQNIAFTGVAGAGKTMLLNRIAHQLIEEEKTFIYLTFSETLKEKFQNFIKDKLQQNPDVGQVFTFEQFVHEQLAPYYGIDSSNYLRLFEYEKFVHNYLTTIEKSLKLKTTLSNSACARILMTLPTFELDIDKPKAIKLDIVRMIESKLHDLMISKAISCTPEDIVIVKQLTEQFVLYVKNQRRKHWFELLDELNARSSKKEAYPVQYVLLDEMQDLGQLEYMLLLKFIQSSHTTKYIVTFDANQRIALEGSLDRNFERRLVPLKTNPKTLTNSYRNSSNIRALSTYFLNIEPKPEPSDFNNISNSKIKVIKASNTDSVVQALLTNFIPEENVNVGVVAFGKTYEKYRPYFLDTFGRRKHVGVDFYNEETIKGLEYTNLIILDFFELSGTNRNITKMEFNKWYVAITRACDNLLIHMKSQDEYEYAMDYLAYDFFNKDYIITYENNRLKNAFEQFTKDTLISLDDEQRAILAKEAHTLFQSYLETKNIHLFADAAEIFHELRMYETFRHLLQLHYEEAKQPSLFALELILLAIEQQDEELFNKYVQSVKKELYWFIATHKKLPDGWKPKLKGTKSRLQVATEIEAKTLELEQLDTYIQQLYNAKLFNEIIHFYKNKKPSLQMEAYNLIARAYKNVGLPQEGLAIYWQHGLIDDATQILENSGEFDQAFEQLYTYMANNRERSSHYAEKLFSLAVKSIHQKKAYLKRILDFKNSLTKELIVKICYELYTIDMEQAYAQMGLEIAFEEKLYDSIFDFYFFNMELVKLFPDIQQLLLVKEEFRELGKLYSYLKLPEKEFEAYMKAYQKYASVNIRELHLFRLLREFDEQPSTDSINAILVTYKEEIKALCALNPNHFEHIQLVIRILEKSNQLEDAILHAYHYNCFEDIIHLVTQHQIQATKETYEAIANSYEQVKDYKNASLIYQSMHYISKAVKIAEQIPIEERPNLVKQYLQPIVDELLQNIENLESLKNDRLQELFVQDYELGNVKNIHHFAEKTIEYWLKENIDFEQNPAYIILLKQPKKRAVTLLHLLHERQDYHNLYMYYRLFEKDLATIEALKLAIHAAEQLKIEPNDLKCMYELLIEKLLLRQKNMTARECELMVSNIGKLLRPQFLQSVDTLYKTLIVLEPVFDFASNEQKKILFELAHYALYSETVTTPKRLLQDNVQKYISIINKFAATPLKDQELTAFEEAQNYISIALNRIIIDKMDKMSVDYVDAMQRVIMQNLLTGIRSDYLKIRDLLWKFERATAGRTETFKSNVDTFMEEAEKYAQKYNAIMIDQLQNNIVHNYETVLNNYNEIKETLIKYPMAYHLMGSKLKLAEVVIETFELTQEKHLKIEHYKYLLNVISTLKSLMDQLQPMERAKTRENKGIINQFRVKISKLNKQLDVKLSEVNELYEVNSHFTDDQKIEIDKLHVACHKFKQFYSKLYTSYEKLLPNIKISMFTYQCKLSETILIRSITEYEAIKQLHNKNKLNIKKSMASFVSNEKLRIIHKLLEPPKLKVEELLYLAKNDTLPNHLIKTYPLKKHYLELKTQLPAEQFNVARKMIVLPKNDLEQLYELASSKGLEAAILTERIRVLEELEQLKIIEKMELTTEQVEKIVGLTHSLIVFIKEHPELIEEYTSMISSFQEAQWSMIFAMSGLSDKDLRLFDELIIPTESSYEYYTFPTQKLILFNETFELIEYISYSGLYSLLELVEMSVLNTRASRLLTQLDIYEQKIEKEQALQNSISSLPAEAQAIIIDLCDLKQTSNVTKVEVFLNMIQDHLPIETAVKYLGASSEEQAICNKYADLVKDYLLQQVITEDTMFTDESLLEEEAKLLALFVKAKQSAFEC